MEKKKSQVDKYHQKKRSARFITCILLVLLVILAVLSMLIGQYGISPIQCARILLGAEKTDVSTVAMLRNILVNIRLPRTIAAILIGASLSLAGLTYQCVFRNILVSQDILGVNTGACVGAATAIILDLSTVYIQGFSFMAGMLSVFLVFILSRAFRTEKTLSLILSGILISGLMSSVLGYIKYTANPESHLQTIVFWIMGDISSVSMKQISEIAIPAFVCTALILINKWKLNYFCYSDSEAISLGFNVNAFRTLFIVCATILVSLSVSVAGSIGWIGLVMPLLARILVGTDNNDTAGLTLILGAVFLLLMDIINRLISSTELPISILTGIVGTPIFVVCLVLKQKGEQSGYARGT